MKRLACLLTLCLAPAAARAFVCAGGGVPAAATGDEGVAAAAKPLAGPETRSALALFAGFPGDDERVPPWAQEIFAADRPGSLSHFYATMSLGALRIEGQVAPRRYLSQREAAAFVADEDTAGGQFGQLVAEVLGRADADIDFTRFDNDGPDGAPDSGDDDGIVDLLYVVLPAVPDRFFVGEATGIASLGLTRPFETSDRGADGRPIRIDDDHGTTQVGRTRAEAVGSMAHETGHLLRLPDLYDVAFLASPSPRDPAQDSAGIGRWDLMGWGALGWNGDDGPASLSAWSRVRLGWARVQQVESADEVMSLPPVALDGQLYEIPVSPSESFLLEYRSRASYYDRNIPAEGLLVWHVRREPGAWHIDLECADGRWREGGYPVGTTADPAGGDNLDFWAHDTAYAQAHGGNLGDGTDVFDGVRYAAFTRDSNPDSWSQDRARAVRITGIRVAPEAVTARVEVDPPRIEFEQVAVADADDDGVLVAGEEAAVHFRPVNAGGLRLEGARAHLESGDDRFEAASGATELPALGLGEAPLRPITTPPRLRVLPGFAGERSAELALVATLDGVEIGRHRLAVTAVSARQRPAGVTILDPAGNGDGVAAAGEFVRLRVRLEGATPARLQGLRLTLSSLSPTATRIDAGSLAFGADARGGAVSHTTPEFLLSSAARAGESLPFLLFVSSPYESWRDTLQVTVGAGVDATPPRITLVRARGVAEGLRVQVSQRWILEGGWVDSVEALVFAMADTQRVAQLPMPLRDGVYEVLWPGAPGTYLVAARAVDGRGNAGRSDLVHAVRPESRAQVAPGAFVVGADWQRVDLPEAEAGRMADVVDLAIAADGRTWYGATASALWRSLDAGETWTRTALMFAGYSNRDDLYIDPVDPFTVYVAEAGQMLVSHDGGNGWTRALAPADRERPQIRMDPVLPGRLFVTGPGYLLVSEDEGRSWREHAFDGIVVWMTTHPADREVTYVLSYEPDVAVYLNRSDDGRTWTRARIEVDQLEPDPLVPNGFYGIAGDSLRHSADGGATWSTVGTVPEGVWRLRPSPLEDGVLYAWGTATPLYRTQDRGRTWKAAATVPGLAEVVQMPGRPEGVIAKGYLGPVVSYDQGQGRSFAPVAVAEAVGLVSALWYDPAARLHAAAMRQTGANAVVRSVFVEDGPDWVRQGDASPFAFVPTPLGSVFQDPLHPEILIASIVNALATFAFVRSADGGSTWAEVSLGNLGYGYISGSFLPRAQIASDPSRDGVYFIAQESAMRSADYGVTWTEIGPWAAAKIHPSVSFSRSAGGLVYDVAAAGLYVAFRDSLWYTADDGGTWEVRGRIRPRTVCLDLIQSERRYGHLLAATWDGLFRSEDEGRTWARQLAPEGEGQWQTARLRPDPTDDDGFYLVTDRRLYASHDGGVHWDPIEDGFGGAAWFHDVAPDPLNPGRLHVATSWGLYVADDGAATAVLGGPAATPAASQLEQSYPNPFNGETVIRFRVGRPGPVALEVYDLLGQRVRRVLRGPLEAGDHTACWDGRDEAGRPVASGVYLYRLEAPGYRATRKLLLVR